jgi:hypothetical protein
MAITIHQQPDPHSAISTPLIITASSTNSSNDGFKYVVRVSFVDLPDVNATEYVVSPNPNFYMVFDLVSSARPFLRLLNQQADGSPTGVHSNIIYNESTINITEDFDGLPGVFYYKGSIACACRVLEGWDIDGVFTVNEESETGVSCVIYNFLDFTTRDGYKPSLLAQIGHENGDQSRLMSDRLPSTYYWQYAESVSLNPGNAIYVPTRESDWGVWTIRQYQEEGSIADQAKKIKLSILPNSGPPVQQIYPFTYKEFSHIPVYPANLNASTLSGILKPQDYPNWKAIYFQILNDDDEQTSMTYVMFNVDRPQTGICNCHEYTPIRLAWVGRRGGWEYYNFNMLSEQEYATEQKISKRIVGNYGDVSSSTDFTFNTFDESERVVYKKIDKFITCSTDKLQQGEWEFLKGLILSKQVHWVHDDGAHTPVIVQDSNIRVRNINAKTLEPITIRIKVAQEQPN